MESTADILRKAKALIDAPEKWTKGAFCRSAAGKAVSTFSRDAVCFCAVGAIARLEVTGVITDVRASRAEEALRDAIHATAVSHWNDAPERTHAEVMAAFDKAIALAESKAGRPSGTGA